MYPTRLILKDFVSFEYLDYKFQEGPIVIIGDNRTQDDQAQNGTGKTSILNGLFYGIYGVNLRNKEDKKFIRQGQKSAYIRVELYCPVRKETLSIEREIRMKGSSTLKIKSNDEDISIPTVNEGNKWITNWIEVSPEDAKSYYIVTKGNYKSFFTSSNTDKLALIGRFINYSAIDNTKDVIERKSNEIDSEKFEYQKQQFSIQGKITAYTEQIEKLLNENPEEKRQEQISAIKQSISDLVTENESLKESIENWKSEIESNEKSSNETMQLIEEVEKELLPFENVSYEDTYKEIDENIREINNEIEVNRKTKEENDRQIQTYRNQMRRIETILAGVIECPNCHHQFLLDSEEDLSTLERKSKKIKSEIDKSSVEVEKINSVLNELNDIMEECCSIRKQTQEEEQENLNQKRNIQNKLNQLKDKVTFISLSIERINKKIENATENIFVNEKAIKQYEECIEKIKSASIVKADVSKQKKELEKLNIELNEYEEKIRIKESESNKIRIWNQRFKDFKMYLAMEQIKTIQQSTNEILQKMESDLRLRIEGFKKNASGKVVEEITPYIFRDELELFSYYSGGERVRIEIALIIALQQAINSTKRYGGLQFLFVDEILESADSLGIENIVSSMNFLKQPILIITHVPKLNEEIKQLKVIKENGISRIEE